MPAPKMLTGKTGGHMQFSGYDTEGTVYVAGGATSAEFTDIDSPVRLVETTGSLTYIQIAAAPTASAGDGSMAIAPYGEIHLIVKKGDKIGVFGGTIGITKLADV